jgi:hypothetical protein
MTDVKHSGYKAAAQSVTFSGTRTLVSLADDEWTDLSDEIDNSVNGYLFADWEFVCTSVAFTGADSAIELYIVPSVDDTNYPDWTGDGIADEQEHNVHFVGAFTTSGATAAQRLTLRGIELPPGKFQVGVRNRGGVALAASGSTLKWRPWQYSSA